MPNEAYGPGGVLLAVADDTARLVTEYIEGVAQQPRPYTPEENARADAAALSATMMTNEADLRAKARNAIEANAAAIDALTIFANETTALTNTQRDQRLRQLAAQQARAFRQLNTLIKLAVRDLTDTTGT